MTSFIVHIGDGKCGSTSIQRALYDARARLCAQGIIYETSSPPSAHFNLRTLVGHPTRGDYAIQLESAHRTVNLIRSATGRGEVVLLSAESFFMLPPAKLVSILEMISPKIDRLDIIAYVRPPSGMYLSLVQQELKGSSHYTKPEAYLHRGDEKLAQWQANKTQTSLTLRLFDRSRLRQGDVVEDFAEVLRRLTGKPSIHLQGRSENASLSSEQLVVLQTMRAQFMNEADGRTRPASNNLVAYFEAMNNQGRLVGHPLRLSADALLVVNKQNAQVVTRLNNLFPGLAMPEPAFDAAAVVNEVWAKTEDVAAILTTANTEIVEQLKSLVPLFNTQLRHGSTERSDMALAALQAQLDDSGTQIVQATADYWKQEGCRAAAVRLEAL